MVFPVADSDVDKSSYVSKIFSCPVCLALYFDSLAPRICDCDSENAISEQVTDSIHENFLWNCSHVNVTEYLWWQVKNRSGKSPCHQETSHYLSQWWLISMSSYGDNMPLTRTSTMILCDLIQPVKIQSKQSTAKETMQKRYIFEVITVAADGLAPLGARPSAGTVMTMFGSFMHMGPALAGLHSQTMCAKGF